LQWSVRLNGNDQGDTIQSLTDYGRALRKLNRMPEATAAFADAISADRKAGRGRTLAFIHLLYAHAEFVRTSGDSAGAIEPYREAADLLRSIGPDDPGRGQNLYWLGRCLLDSGRPAEAEAALRENYAYDLEHPGSDHPPVPNSLRELVASLKAQGKPADIGVLQAEFHAILAPTTIPSVER
jgi:tetratricopeptide (TPR) repeat protein